MMNSIIGVNNSITNIVLPPPIINAIVCRLNLIRVNIINIIITTSIINIENYYLSLIGIFLRLKFN